MACAALAARRVLAHGTIVIKLNNAFAIIISSLSELYVNFLLEPTCCQLLKQQNPDIPAGPAASARESAMMRKSGGAAEAAPEAAIVHFSLV